MDKETAKELALISSYIVAQDLLNGTVFQTFDSAYELAEQFLQEYHIDYAWGVTREWDETLEEFVNERYINGKKLENEKI